MEIVSLKDSVRKSEYLSLKVYLCPKGVETIGYGRNLKSNGISKNEAELLLENDLFNIKLKLEDKISYFHKIDDIRQNVLIEMAYNMGVSNLLEFKNTLSYIKKGEYDKASKEMLNSAWHKDFIKYDMADGKKFNGLLRSEFLSKVMLEGKY